MVRPALPLTLSHTVGRPGSELFPSRPDTCSISIIYPSCRVKLDIHTSQRNINPTFELHDSLKPIYSIRLVVLSRCTARAVSDILFCLSVSPFQIWSSSHPTCRHGWRVRRGPPKLTHGQSAVSYTLHPARVSVSILSP